MVPNRVGVGFFKACDLKVSLQNEILGGPYVFGPFLIEPKWS
jgi:hypothetical protein